MGMQRFVWILWLIVDLALMVVFATTGRSSHNEELSAGGIFQVAWPFMVAVVIAFAVTRGWETYCKIWPHGFIYWGLVVILGILLRVIAGSTAAMPFILVTAGVLFLFLIGRRMISGLFMRHRV